MRKRTWNTLLSLCLATALLCSTCAFAADTADEGQPANSVVLYDGEEPHEHDYVAGKCACGDILPEYQWYYGSTGTSYSIGSAGEMAALAVLVNEGDNFSGKTVTLSCDIDLSTIANWTPIGNAEKVDLSINGQEELNEAAGIYKVIYDDVGNSYTTSEKDAPYAEGRSFYYVNPTVFSGTFDGGGHTISGLSLSTDLGYAGLFGNVNGTVRNFTLNGTVEFTGSNGDYIGSVAGMLSMGGTISRVISNVIVNAGGTRDAAGVSNGDGAYNVGGIAGFVGTPLSNESAKNTFITMCVNNGTVTGYNKVGGIAGENAGIVSLCVNNASKVSATRTGSKNGTGGIVGRNGNNNAAHEAGTVVNCYNTGAVSGGKWSGGVVGFNNVMSTIENCYTTRCPSLALSYSNPVVGKDESYLGENGCQVRNNYTLNYDGLSYTSTVEREIGILLESDELQKAAYALGSAYRSSPTGGYPELAWMLDCRTVAFDVAPAAAEYAVTVVDNLGLPVDPESNGSYLLVNGVTYTYTVSASGYRPVSGSLTVTADETVRITLNEVIGPVVTVNNAAGTAAAVNGIVSGLDYEPGSLTFHVDCDLACVVAYTTDGGETYTRLTAAANEGGYDFTINLTADVEIAVVQKGDLNLNGTVNGADSLLVQRAAAGITTLTPLKMLAADVNGNGSINGADALLIQRSAAGLMTIAW